MRAFVRDLLVCPGCGGELEGLDSVAGIRCLGCGADWVVVAGDVPYVVDEGAVEGTGLGGEIEAQRHACLSYVDRRKFAFYWDRIRMQDEVELLGSGHPVVLDVGCGAGLLVEHLDGCDVVGVDVSPELLELARTRNENVIGARAESLPLPDSCVDAIYGRSVLHHTIDPEKAAREMFRVLRPGGIAVFSDPRAFKPLEQLKHWLRREHPMYADTHTAFSKREYHRLLSHCGFEIIQSLNPDPLVLPFLVVADSMHLWQILPARRTVQFLMWVEARLELMLRRLPGFRTFGFTLVLVVQKP